MKNYYWFLIIFFSFSSCDKKVVIRDNPPALSGAVTKTDRFVPYTSIIPNHTGAAYQIFLREKVSDSTLANNLNGKVVLLIHGTSISSTPLWDLEKTGYSLMEHLAKSGYDVFCMDLAGYGFSSRPAPMNIQCNLNNADKAALGIANCTIIYPYTMTTAANELAEIKTVVEYIKTLRAVTKINIVGSSIGSSRAMLYTKKYPVDIEKMILFSVGTAPGSSNNPAQIPANGYPMNIVTKTELENKIQQTNNAADQLETGIIDLIWEQVQAADVTAKTWGTGGSRSPNFQFFGLTATDVATLTQPVLIMNGEYDNLALPFFGSILYNQFTNSSAKLFLEVKKTSHYMPWEIRGKFAYRAAADFLEDNKVNGVSNKKGIINENGDYLW